MQQFTPSHLTDAAAVNCECSCFADHLRLFIVECTNMYRQAMYQTAANAQFFDAEGGGVAGGWISECHVM